MSNLNTSISTLQVGPGIVMARPVSGNIPSQPRPWEYGVLQELSLDIDQKIVTAMGQFKMPVDSAAIDMNIKGSCSLLQLSGGMLANGLLGDGPTLNTTQVTAYREAHTLTSVPLATHAVSTPVTQGIVFNDGTNLQICTTAGTTAATAPTWNTVIGATTTDGTAVWTCCGASTGVTNTCTVVVTNATNYAQDENVMYQSNNNQLAIVAPPAQGDYFAAGNGVYLFNASDATSSVFITYDYTSTTLGNSYPILQHTQGYGPVLTLNIQFPYQTSSSAALNRGVYLTAVRMGKFSVKTKRDGYMQVTFDYEAYAPANGTAGYFYMPN